MIKGTVKDTSGEPIIGATIRIKGVSNKGTVSADIDGNFTHEAGPNDELTISYIGFAE
ncbi:MAG: carboxypeptidase-like regulatory domain-containing protein [Prevotella sp.]|nr:carboxypeptidase-like regulatory domain-containing protein [Prevotella sp.]